LLVEALQILIEAYSVAAQISIEHGIQASQRSYPVALIHLIFLILIHAPCTCLILMSIEIPDPQEMLKVPDSLPTL
jgi:hypothetical protein